MLRRVASLLPLLLCVPSVALADPSPVARHVTPSGLEVLVVEMHATPLVTVEIAAHNGAFTESPEYNGLSHLYEHMFFKGNAKLPDQTAYMARARELGLSWNGTTDKERVNYFFTTSSDRARDAMEFMRDAIVTPKFDEKELERERVVVTGEIDRAESEPSYYLWETIEREVFWKYPTRKDALGARKTVLSATTTKMRTIQSRYYVPNNSALVVTGDVKANDVFSQADTLYASWKKADDPLAKYAPPKNPAIRASKVVLVPQPVSNVSALIEWQGPSTLDASIAATYPATLLVAMLNDSGSKFQRALVDSGLCVAANGEQEILRYTGELRIGFEALPEKSEACTKAVFAELAKLGSADYFADEEMKNAAVRVSLAHVYERETTEARAHGLTRWWANATIDYGEHEAEKVAAVTHADLTKLVADYVTGKPFVLAAMAKKDVIGHQVDAAKLESAARIATTKAVTK